MCNAIAIIRYNIKMYDMYKTFSIAFISNWWQLF